MNIDTVITQIKAVATIFGGNVAGAAKFAQGSADDQVWLPMPAAYVIRGEEDADSNDSLNALEQTVRERVSVIIVIPTLSAGGSLNITDRRGQAAADQIEPLRNAVFKALLNWRPVEDGGDATGKPSARGFYYIGARFPAEGAFDRARFFYQFVFGLDTTITEQDGWTAAGTALTDIRATIESQVTSETLATADAPV